VGVEPERRNHSVIFLNHYLDRLYSIRVQFEFARKAIKGFIEHTEPDTVIPSPPPAMTLASLMSTTGIEQMLNGMSARIEFAKGGFPDKYKKLENPLAQNEIILMVAVFEDQMKAIHREVLRQKPSLLNPDRQIKLGKLVALSEQRVIEGEIESAVQVLDRQSVKDRAKVLAKLGLPWGTRVEPVDHMSILRNKILHEDIDVQVGGWELSLAMITAVILPLNLYLRAEKLYPSGFDSGVSDDEKEHTKALVEKTIKNRKLQQSILNGKP
jgi:hypothetical protein